MERVQLDDIVDVGDAITETRGAAAVGRDDPETGQFYLIGGIDQDD